MKKKILCAIICTAMFVFTALSATAATGVIKAGSASGKPGDTVTVNITVEGNAGIVGMILRLSYDEERLELISATDGGLFGTGTATFGNDFSAVPYIMLWDDSLATSNHTENGTLATLRFRILSDAPDGKAMIVLSYDEDSTFDKDLNSVKFTVSYGAVNVLGSSTATTAATTSAKAETTTAKPTTTKAAAPVAGTTAKQATTTVAEKTTAKQSTVAATTVKPGAKSTAPATTLAATTTKKSGSTATTLKPSADVSLPSATAAVGNKTEHSTEIGELLTDNQSVTSDEIMSALVDENAESSSGEEKTQQEIIEDSGGISSNTVIIIIVCVASIAVAAIVTVIIKKKKS